jgi:hypothetical protein
MGVNPHGPLPSRARKQQMGRKGAIFLEGLRAAGIGLSVKIRSHPRWPLGINGSVLAVAVLALMGVLAFDATREASTMGRAPSPALSSSRPAPTPQRPAFTRAEEAYIQALWPIHGDVERSAVRVSLGKIFYKTNDMGKPELKARVDDALATYRRAETRISALQVPPSLERAHNDYLAAVGLFEKSALEVLKMFDDGNDDHLLAAYPLSQEGSNKIRAVGAQFWQDEFPPH